MTGGSGGTSPRASSTGGPPRRSGRGVRCMLMRGGTSKGLYFLASDLPADRSERDAMLLAIMGSGHPMQVDGVGGAHPLASKVALVSPSSRADADIDYLFLQLGVEEATVTALQNCGNILAGVGQFAAERGLIITGNPSTTVRIHMVNSGSVVTATFATPGGRSRVRRRHDHRWRSRQRRPCPAAVRRHRGLGDGKPAAHRSGKRRHRRRRDHLRGQRHAGGRRPRRRSRHHRVRAVSGPGAERGAGAAGYRHCA